MGVYRGEELPLTATQIEAHSVHDKLNAYINKGDTTKICLIEEEPSSTVCALKNCCPVS